MCVAIVVALLKSDRMRQSYVSKLIDTSIPLKLKMAGATLSGRMVCCFGAFAGIYAAAMATFACNGMVGGAYILIAPIGASAVLAFAVPSSPLAQPWSIIGGNCISAVTGALIAHAVPWMGVAGALAVASAILVMTLTRSLHPPGGACALVVVLAFHEHPGLLNGMLVSLAINSVVLAAVAVVFHRLGGRSYPHRAAKSVAEREDQDLLHPDDIRAALYDLGETFDVTPQDLDSIFRTAQAHRLHRLNRTGGRAA